MLLLNGIQAWIEVDGVELTQYSVENSPSGDTVTCWIPCEEAKNFTVCWRNTQTTFGTVISGTVTIDGQRCGSSLPPIGHPNHTVRSSGIHTSDASMKPFMFSTLELTDDDNYLMSSAAAKDLGEISLAVWDVLQTGVLPERPRDVPSKDRKVHERSKKSLAHCVTFGEEEQTTRKCRVECKFLACRATFVFRYRSIGILRANGIAPMPAPGKKRAAEDPPEPQDSDEDADNELKELRALEERIKVIKAKHNRKKVKTENIESKFVPGEIIDLT